MKFYQLLFTLFTLPFLPSQVQAQEVYPGIGPIAPPAIPEVVSCRYPIHVSADSLVNFVRHDFARRTGARPQIDSADWKRYFYDNSRGINFDSAYWRAQKFLLQKLGRPVFCNYVDLTINSFATNTENNNEFSLTFFLQLPNLENPKQQGYMHYKYEVLPLKFTFYLKPDNSLNIIYPPYVPDCNGQPDCGFIITKDKALAMARTRDIINNSVDYFIETDGKDWIIRTSPDLGNTVTLHRINLKTGEVSDKQFIKKP